MRTVPLAAFVLIFGLAGLGVFLADRLLRDRGQAFLRSYSLHMAFWNGHALIMVMQFILGTEFLPRGSWASLMFVTGPVIFLLAALSMHFLIVFAAQAPGGRPPRPLLAVSIVLWSALAIYGILKAGEGTRRARQRVRPDLPDGLLGPQGGHGPGLDGLFDRPGGPERDEGRG